MTLKEMEIEVSALMEAHPNQKVLLFLAMDDAFSEEEDHAPRLDELLNWCKLICKENRQIEPLTL